MFIAYCVGTGFGILNGLLTRMALSWAIKRSDKVFYSAWVGGFLYRLVFLGAAVAFLWHNARVFMMPVLLPMIFVQFAMQLWPVSGLRRAAKDHGFESHT